MINQIIFTEFFFWGTLFYKKKKTLIWKTSILKTDLIGRERANRIRPIWESSYPNYCCYLRGLNIESHLPQSILEIIMKTKQYTDAKEGNYETQFLMYMDYITKQFHLFQSGKFWMSYRNYKHNSILCVCVDT